MSGLVGVDGFGGEGERRIEAEEDGGLGILFGPIHGLGWMAFGWGEVAGEVIIGAVDEDAGLGLVFAQADVLVDGVGGVRMVGDGVAEVDVGLV